MAEVSLWKVSSYKCLYLIDDKSTLVQVMAWAVRQQAITWANVDPDPCRHMASLSHNELKTFIRSSHAYCSFPKKFISITLNNFRPRQNCHHFGDGIFKFGFMNGNHCIFIDVVKLDTDTECLPTICWQIKLNWNHAPNIVHLPMQWNAVNTSHVTHYSRTSL